MASSTADNIERVFPIVTSENLSLECKDPVNPQALEQARAILKEISASDESKTVQIDKLRIVAQRLGDIVEGGDILISKETCREAFDNLSEEDRTSLINIHGRVKRFAEAQRASVQDMCIDIPGGKAGHTVSPCRAAGCYAPGGRYPLPSSVIMTAVTARAAGCKIVVLATPRPVPITLAAAHISGADILVAVGGAQAIATMAYGLEVEDGSMAVPPCDVIVGPGNQWVTAAKSIVQGYCGIDMLAGPSEVLVICDDTASPEVVAADLIAQAEHDVIARAIVVTTCVEMEKKINVAVRRQLSTLPEPNRSTALAAMKQSFAVICTSVKECVEVSDIIAPEHLEIHTRNGWDVGMSCLNYGGIFIGQGAAEVLGDYGAGPNHTLPTGGTGRYTGGLSVFDFLRIRTYMQIDSTEQCQDMVRDTVRMARLEGLEGHARAGEQRLISVQQQSKQQQQDTNTNGTNREEKKD
eukprot:CAMPEP_0194132460 /NCGR_PEP_ID=MMETSP0152-20130528/2921_1 /TAXON_ID=1049557 /ORGANISM="Thalassiothrix antarctica, Strain L6-D1" /LENGTH=467 /DNA_ID=CAMNT_0038827523 /DNA_START=175 /DNA_END=1578 /DNA_ORIENTATION=-